MDSYSEYFFQIDHPCSQGHFPDNPIIPGAFLLSEILNVISHKLNIDLSQIEIKAAKFFYPTRPGDTVKIECNWIDEENIKFNCAVKEHKVLAGQVKCKIQIET